MAEPSDSSLAFFKKATPAQWAYVLSHYKDVLKLRAAKRTKKGGPEELIKLDTWYQEQLPKVIRSRPHPHITHEELVQITKWKLMRGKFRPRLVDLVKINTELAVHQISKKAFRKLPNLSTAITALTNLKGIGSATASAILSAGFPEHVPFMADECMLATPGVESTDYTLCEYLNYAEQIKMCTDRLTQKDPEGKWNPHKVELTLWTHYLAREMQPSLLDELPPSTDEDAVRASTPNGKDEGHSPKNDTNESEEAAKSHPEVEEDDSGTKLSYSDESSQESLKTDGESTEKVEPPSKKLCV